jgi:hypothetical protein
MSLATVIALSGIALAGMPAPAIRNDPRAEAAPAPGEASSLPTAVDLRPAFAEWGLQARSQGRRGTCSVFTMAGALEYAAAKQGRPTRLSVEFLNWAAHRAVQRRADGGFFSELWKGYQVYGICPEETLPYRADYEADLQPGPAVLERARELQSLKVELHWIKEWNVKTGLAPDQLDGIKRTLARGWPVCGGFRWPKQERWNEGVLEMCGPEAVFDGHSLLLVGYRDDPHWPGGGAFLIRNSGGNSRDGCLPYAYAQAYMNDAAWVGCEQPAPR